jgi:hypothetical protein
MKVLSSPLLALHAVLPLADVKTGMPGQIYTFLWKRACNIVHKIVKIHKIKILENTLFLKEMEINLY